MFWFIAIYCVLNIAAAINSSGKLEAPTQAGEVGIGFVLFTFLVFCFWRLYDGRTGELIVCIIITATFYVALIGGYVSIGKAPEKTQSDHWTVLKSLIFHLVILASASYVSYTHALPHGG